MNPAFREIATGLRPLMAFLLGAVVALSLCGAIITAFPQSFPTWHSRSVLLGGLLQIWGLGIVIFGLVRSRELFLPGTIWTRTAKRLSRIVKGEKLVAAGAAVSGSASIGIGASVTTRVRRAKLEDRVQALEDQLHQNMQAIGELRRDFEAAKKEAKRQAESEEAHRQRLERTLQEQLKTAVVGGINLEIGGALYIALGILFSSLPASVFADIGKAGPVAENSTGIQPLHPRYLQACPKGH